MLKTLSALFLIAAGLALFAGCSAGVAGDIHQAKLEMILVPIFFGCAMLASLARVA